MGRAEVFLVVSGVVLLAVAMGLLMAHANQAQCVDTVTVPCAQMGFVYEGGGKLALMLGLALFLVAALRGVFSEPK